jgi:hypothetical protein
MRDVRRAWVAVLGLTTLLGTAIAALAAPPTATPKKDTSSGKPDGWIGGANGPAAKGANPKPEVTGKSLGKPHRVDDAMVTTLDVKEPVGVAWSADGKFAFALEKEGTLHKINASDMVEERSLAIASPCSAIVRARPGLAVAVVGSGEIWTLNDNLEVQRRIKAPGVKQLVASPLSPFAYGTAGADALTIIDLVNGVVRELTAKQFEDAHKASFPKEHHNIHLAFWHIAIAPDGRHLFVEGANVGLMRFKVNGREVDYELASPVQADNVHHVEVSADSKYVAVLAGAGNHIEGMPKAAYATYVFATTGDLSKPATVIESGAYPQALGFDVAGKAIYAQNHDKSLIVFNPGGAKGKEYQFAKKGGDVNGFAVHPDGGKLFALADKLYWVELP